MGQHLGLLYREVYMAIIVNGVNIPTNGDFIKVGNTNINKVVCNGVTVWERELGIPIADWTKPNSGWSNVHGCNNDSNCIADIYFNISGHYTSESKDGEYQITSPVFSTSLYNKFSYTGHRYYAELEHCAQVCYSNDKTNWTAWEGTKEGSVSIDNTYTYARVRIRAWAYNDSDDETGYGYHVYSMTFQER